MKNIDWDDLRVFVAVAQAGGLTGAASAMGGSAATLGRRMLTLEQAVARPLFIRRQSGYELTKAGRDLLERARAMQAAARPITDWLAGEDVKPVVRISAGTWTANFLCENFVRLWTADDPFTLVLLTTESRLDIAHREIDIGIRAHKPEGANLAGRKTGSVAHARYCARNASSRARESWISILPEETRTDSAQWVNRQKDLRIVAWANTPRTLYDLICASVGSGVLPCFAGDRNSSLERMGPAIADLQQDQWLVMHDEERHRPDVRTVLDRLRHLLEDHAPLFSGKRALGEAG